MVVAALAEKSKLQDHERMIIRYGISSLNGKVMYGIRYGKVRCNE